MNNLDHTAQIIESVENLVVKLKSDDISLLEVFTLVGKAAEGMSEIKSWWEIQDDESKDYIRKTVMRSFNEDLPEEEFEKLFTKLLGD